MENFQNIQFSVAPDLATKGIKVRAALFSVPNIPRGRGNGLERHIKETINALNIDELLESPIIAEYKRLQKKAGISEPVSPAEYLLKLIQKSGMLPGINRIVDCYNIVSAETLLSMGAHDLRKIRGNHIQLRTTNGTERYTPLGETKPVKVAPGEYGTFDDEIMLCRLDLRQCAETICDQATRNFLVYAQGNAETSDAYVLEGIERVRDNIRDFCDGEWLILD